MQVIVIDNYDSFTFNLVHLIHDFVDDIEVYRNDAIELDFIAQKNPAAILISPGPCTPQTSGISVPLVREFRGKIPIFGVCLGLQAIACGYDCNVEISDKPRHGKTSVIHHNGHSLFRDIPPDFRATRYHSLKVNTDSLNDKLNVMASSKPDNTLMALGHDDDCVYGVQFHPESIASQYGKTLMRNFFEKVKQIEQKQ